MKTKTTILLLAIVTLFAICFSGCRAKPSTLTPEKGAAYFIYVGLADADTGEQKLTMDEALPLVQQALIQKKQGATVLPGWGGFVGDDEAYHENETVMMIINGDESAASALAEELKTLLNAACVYVERHDIQCGIYGGQIIQEVP